MSARRTALSWLAAAIVLAAGAVPALGQEYGPSTAKSRPSKDVTLSFVRAGRIAKVLVKEGDKVEAGQALAQLDDAAERARLDYLKAQADDTTHLRAAEAQLELAKVELQKHEQSPTATTPLEVLRLKVEVRIKALSVELARFNQQQYRRQYEEASIQVDRMQLKSPVAGTVEKIFVHEGESADALGDVVRVVNNDPLWVEADVAVSQVEALGLAVGGKGTVAFPDHRGPGQPKAAEGTIIHIAAVADGASSTRLVRLEVPNTGSPPAGEQLMVSFSAPAEPNESETQAEDASAQEPSHQKE